jgi:AcrR family transcriptional regulator
MPENSLMPTEKKPDTRRRIMDIFFGLLEKRSLDKITVRQICQEAGVNRQTFYYHFGSMDDFLTECMNTAFTGVLGESNVPLRWEDGLYKLLTALRGSKNIIHNIFFSSYRGNLENFMNDYARAILMKAVSECAKRNQIQVSEADQIIVARFYRYVFVGLLIQYIQDDMAEKPEAIMRRCHRIMDYQLDRILIRLAENPDKGR